MGTVKMWDCIFGSDVPSLKEFMDLEKPSKIRTMDGRIDDPRRRAPMFYSAFSGHVNLSETA